MKTPRSQSLLATVFALVLAACGGGGGSGGAQPSAPAASSSSTSAAASSAAENSSSASSAALPCAALASTNTGYACSLTSTLAGTVQWSLSGAPTGMRIQPASGVLHWTPLSAQLGTYTVHVLASNGQQTEDIPLALQVVQGAADPAGIHVAPDGNDSNAGSAAAPLLTVLQAVKLVKSGQTIYLRGGEYRNSEYGQPWASRTRSNLAQITTSGSASAPITLRPLGNEYVRLVSDVNALTIKSAHYWTIQGLELVGANSTLGTQTALSRWWSDPGNSLGAAGIANAGGDHLTITGCVIHDFPDAGISVNGAEYVTIADNTVYNNGWWTTGGTHGISVSQMVSTAAGAGQNTIAITGNLVFSNQSLVISHVFSKGQVTLAIDEGNGLHLQDSDSTYTGRARVSGNLLLFNGKGGLGINRMSQVELLNNGFYRNARVANTGELRLQSSPMAQASGNLFQPRAERITIDDADKAYVNVGSNASTGTAADAGLYPAILRLPAVFAAPAAMDFSPAAQVATGIGVPAATLSRMKSVLAEYGIQPAEPTQVVDASYLASMKAAIFSSWPATYPALQLFDPLSGYTYSYAQRCQYPAAPSSSVCP